MKVLVATLLSSPLGLASDWSAPDLNALLDHMEQAQAATHARSTAYSVTREYDLFDGNAHSPKSRVVARVSFAPPSSKNFSIERSTGSGQGQKVVKRILEHETDVARDASSSAITRRNYSFALRGESQLSGHKCYVLELTPLRKDKELLQGHAWIDADSYLVRRIEGDTARSPSFWLKNVHISMEFAEVMGMWLQTALQAVADVRFFGRHVMTGHDLSYDGPAFSASAATGSHTVSLIRARRLRQLPPAAVLP